MCIQIIRKHLRFFHRWMAGTFVPLVFAVFLVFLGYLIHLKMTGQPYGYLKRYYDYVNDVPGSTAQFPPELDIVLIDAHDESIGGREGMARLLNYLAAQNPKAVGLDILYPNTNESTSYEDSVLMKAVREYPAGKLVVACRRRDRDSLEHSFFTKPSKLDYGTVNAQSFYGFSPTDTYKDGEVEKMVVALAKKATSENDRYEMKEGELVNYTNRSFQVVSSWQDIESTHVEGRIVLIGDLREEKDLVDLPFRIEGKYVGSGLMVNAYQLSNLIHPQIRLKAIPKGWSWVLCFFLLLAYVFIICWLDYHLADKSKSAIMIYKMFIGPFIIIVLELAALLVLIHSIKACARIPDLLLFMAAIPFVQRTCASYDIKYPIPKDKKE